MAGPLTGPGITSIINLNEEANFANDIAAYSGLDPRVVYAWATQETGGKALGHNWLNLRPYPGDPYSSVTSGGFESFSSLGDAEKATERRLAQPFAKGIIGAAGEVPQAEIAAIAASNWDAGHYGGPGGPNLVATFRSIYSDAALTSKATSGVVTPGGTTTTGGFDPFGIGSTIGDITGTFTSITDAFKFIFSYRFLEILGGGLLLLMGLYLLSKQFGVSLPKTPAQTAANSVSDAV